MSETMPRIVAAAMLTEVAKRDGGCESAEDGIEWLLGKGLMDYTPGAKRGDDNEFTITQDGYDAIADVLGGKTSEEEDA